jgi:DNA-binding LacI/PurR family transcriptional regulator
MPMRPRIRLKDIAEKTGYSINTVSVALRGGGRVPPETRARIVETARELNYLPNALARSLAKRKSGTIGIVINNFLNPTLTACAEHISKLLEDRGYRAVIVATHNDVEREKRAVDSLRAYQVDGILIYPARQQHVGHIATLRGAGFPIIMLAGIPNTDIDLVCVDDHLGAFKLTQHLLQLGHRRIALVDIGYAQGNFGKFNGYRAAHLAAGFEVDLGLVSSPAGAQPLDCGYRATAELMAREQRPTAIIGCTDMIAMGVISSLREREVAIPDEVAVAGFDDIELAGSYGVQLTTVGYSIPQIGRQAVERMIGLLGERGALPRASVQMIEPELFVRGSTRQAGQPRARVAS